MQAVSVSTLSGWGFDKEGVDKGLFDLSAGTGGGRCFRANTFAVSVSKVLQTALHDAVEDWEDGNMTSQRF